VPLKSPFAFAARVSIPFDRSSDKEILVLLFSRDVQLYCSSRSRKPRAKKQMIPRYFSPADLDGSLFARFSFRKHVIITYVLAEYNTRENSSNDGETRRRGRGERREQKNGRKFLNVCVFQARYSSLADLPPSIRIPFAKRSSPTQTSPRYV